jgi:predicted membrane GTPase involved in stress response
MEITIPTRGLIGFEFELLNLTSGEGNHVPPFQRVSPRHRATFAHATPARLSQWRKARR